MAVLFGVGIVVGLIVVYLAVIVFLPVLRFVPIPIQRHAGLPATPPDEQDGAELQWKELDFIVEGQQLKARLYLPHQAEGPLQCVIMSHGLGGTQDFALARYARRLTAAGIAAFSYDYRHFGESEGQPRQLYSAPRQLQDLRGAVACARSQREVDEGQILLWGTSAAAGYGVVLAAEDRAIAAVIAQCGALDHKADGQLFLQREGYGTMFRILAHAQRDKGRSRFGLPPHHLPIVGPPDSGALLRAPGAFEGYARLAGTSATFRNELVARSMLTGHIRDTVAAAAEVECPVLFLSCEQDNLAHPESWRRAAAALGAKATVRTFPVKHFEIYEGQPLEQAMAEMLAFINQHRGQPRRFTKIS